MTYRDELSLRGDVGRSVAKPQLGLQRVEVGFKFSLLLGLGGLGDAGVLAELLQPLLGSLQGSLGAAVVEPGQGLLDPLQELRGSEGKGEEIRRYEGVRVRERRSGGTRE